MSPVDACGLPDGELVADIAIIGTGAAGLAIATQLAGTSLHVLLVEGGDLGHRHRSQFQYLGENVGRRSHSTIFSRFRRFGGSTTRWGGQCRPLDDEDFERWPVTGADMRSWYERAHRFCQIPRADFAPASWLGANSAALALQSERLRTCIYQFSHPTDLGLVHRAALDAAPNVQVLTNATLVALHTDAAGGHVTHLDLAGTTRGAHRVRARHVVLACGGIENARLLLACAPGHPRGLGNAHDLVGRYFMDHPYVFPGYLESDAPGFAPYVIEGYEQTGSEQLFHAALTLSPALRRAEGLNAAALYLVRRPRHKAQFPYTAPGGVALNHLVEVLQHREHPNDRIGEDCAALLRDAPNALRAAWGRLRALRRADPVLALRIALEGTPMRDSRVTLGTQRDRHGIPRVRVDWRMADSDLRGYQRLLQVLGEELPSRGLGRLVMHGALDADGWPAGMLGGKHHMGTTRMHEDPAHGVVDAHCRVHGIDNLHVGGSSVFTTGGFANPTFSIAALAIRLADRLKTLA
ncbi:MAG: GMC family oxidoreductase [Steroidobacteraceae bacterium]